MREYDVENVEDKMRAFLDKRDEQLIQKSEGKDRAENVKYLGKTEMEYNIGGNAVNLKKDVYVVREKINGKIVNKIYTEDMEPLGIEDENFGVVTLERNEKQRDELERLRNNKQVKDLEKINNKILEDISKETGVEKERVQKIVQADLGKELGLDENKIESEAKQEIDADDLVNNYDTFGQVIGTGGKFDKFYLVETAEAGLDKSTEMGLVGVRADGTMEDLSKYLEYDEATGNRGQTDALSIDADETARENNANVSRYRVKGTNKTISVAQGEQGTSEAGEWKVYVGTKTHGGNYAVEHQVETRNTWPTSREIRGIQEKNETVYDADRMAKEYDVHERAGEKETRDLADVDGNPETKTHTHELPEEHTYGPKNY